MIDPLQYGSDAARAAASLQAIGAPRRAGSARPDRHAGFQQTRPLLLRITGGLTAERIRRSGRLRPRQALAPLKTAMWAACPLG